jgi:hypothetical protein
MKIGSAVNEMLGADRRTDKRRKLAHHCNFRCEQTKNYFYCCTVHFDDSITFIHQLIHLYIYYQSLKHFVHLLAPTCFDT